MPGLLVRSRVPASGGSVCPKKQRENCANSAKQSRREFATIRLFRSRLASRCCALSRRDRNLADAVRMRQSDREYLRISALTFTLRCYVRRYATFSQERRSIRQIDRYFIIVRYKKLRFLFVQRFRTIYYLSLYLCFRIGNGIAEEDTSLRIFS